MSTITRGRALALGAGRTLHRARLGARAVADQADPLTPAEFAAFMAEDMASWAEVAKATGPKPGN